MINNNNYKTLPIGTIFTYNGNKYRVYEDDDYKYICPYCAFYGTNCDNIRHIIGNCISSSRTDNIRAYYKKINNETMNKDNDTKENVVIPTFKDNNSLDDLHVECPKGYIIDVKHTDLSKGIIKFKKNNITLEDIYKDIPINQFATGVVYVDNTNPYYNKLEAISQLMDIANYYNKGWEAEWDNEEENKYFICYSKRVNKYNVAYSNLCNHNSIYFKNKVDAQNVIDNPNFKSILDYIYKN